jgi:hypothetical protein
MQRRSVFRSEAIPHDYDLGAKGLPLTIADRDVEGKPVPGIAYTTHLSGISGS